MPMFTQKIVSLVRAVLSGRDKKLQAERDAICVECDQYVERPVKSIWGKWIMQAYCKACGCGTGLLANMKSGKNALRKVKCPKKKWPGDAESEGLTLHQVNILFGAKDRLEYNMALVQSSIDRQKPLDPLVQASIFGQPPAASRAPVDEALPGKALAGAVNAAQPQVVPADKFDKAFPENQPVSTTERNNGRTLAENIEQGRKSMAEAQSILKARTGG